MTADAVLLVIVGFAAGFGIGYSHAWRLARKLERHCVCLQDWDEGPDATDDEFRAHV